MPRKQSVIKQELSTELKKIESLKGEERATVLSRIKTLTDELNEANTLAESRKLVAEKEITEAQDRAGRKFSLTKFLREIADNNLEGLEREISEEGAKEFRELGFAPKGHVIPSALFRTAAGQNYTTDADGGYLKEIGAIRYIDSLREKLVVTKLGATILGDLVGTIPFVTDSAITASWEAESAESTLSKVTFSKATMSPHRNFIGAAFSKDLLKQTSIDVEQMLMNLLLSSHATLLEKAAINGAGTNNQPTGILNTNGIGDVAMGTNGGAITWAKVVELESKINAANANAGQLAYLTNSKVWGSMKTVSKDTGSGRFILDYPFSDLNGYKAEWSNCIPSDLTKGNSSGICSVLIFGNFNDLHIGQWGGLDIVIDPYTLATSGEVRIVINAYNDVLITRPASFAAIKDILI